MNSSFFNFKMDLRSKVLDGVVPAAVLLLMMLTVLISVGPIHSLFGGPGTMILNLGLLAVSMFSLHRSLVVRFAETTRAWYGMAGGLLAWSVIEISGLTGVSQIASLNGLMLLILVSLIAAQLWRSFPVGGRYFIMIFLAYWTAQIIVGFLEAISGRSFLFWMLYRLWGIASALGLLGVIWWIFSLSERRSQRTWASLALVVLATMALYVFWGRI